VTERPGTSLQSCVTPVRIWPGPPVARSSAGQSSRLLSGAAPVRVRPSQHRRFPLTSSLRAAAARVDDFRLSASTGSTPVNPVLTTGCPVVTPTSAPICSPASLPSPRVECRRLSIAWTESTGNGHGFRGALRRDYLGTSAGRSRPVIAFEAGGRRFKSCLADEGRPVAQSGRAPRNADQHLYIRTRPETATTHIRRTAGRTGRHAHA
jgi:hypothetical protein